MTQRFRYLDGLRGVAALIVVLAHYFQFFLPAAFAPNLADHLGEKRLAASPFNLFINGNFAVALFFVLSGFVLSAPFFLRGDKGWYLGAAVKRYPRLALPAVASTLLAAAIGLTAGYYYAPIVRFSGEGMPNFWADVNDLRVALWQGFAGSFFFDQEHYNKVLWSIRAELLGSFLVFLAVPALGRLKLRWLAYAAGVVLLAKTYLLAFVLGALLADLLALQKKPLGRVATGALFVAGLYLASFPYHSLAGSIWSPLGLLDRLAPAFVLSHILGAALLVGAMTQSARAQAWMQSGPALWLGRISFSMYLVHFTLLASAGCWLVLLWTPALGYANAVLLAFAPVLLLVFAASWVFCAAVDEPTLRLVGGLARRLPVRRPAVAVESK